MALDTAAIIKGAVGVLGVSGLGVGGYYGIQALNNQENKETIEKQLGKNNLRKLARGNNEWKNIFASYQTVSAKDKTLKFSGEVVDSSEKLQTRCEEILNKNTSEDSTTNNYLEKAKKWCVEPISVLALLTAQRLPILSTTLDDAGTKAKWDKKVTAYRDLTDTPKVFGELNVGAKSAGIEDVNRKSIKDKCDAAGKILNYKEEYEENLKNFKDWCTELN